jgi:drug/metabolite transporter (DMT)-like permease
VRRAPFRCFDCFTNHPISYIRSSSCYSAKDSKMILNWLVAVATMMFLAFGQVLLKLLSTEFSRTSLTPYGLWDNVIPISKLIAGLMVTYLVVLVLWLFVLSRMELSRAFPFAALTFIFVPLLSFAIFGEQISVGVIFGASLIVLGIAVSFAY